MYAGHVYWLLDDLSAGLTHDAVVDDPWSMIIRSGFHKMHTSSRHCWRG